LQKVETKVAKSDLKMVVLLGMTMAALWAVKKAVKKAGHWDEQMAAQKVDR